MTIALICLLITGCAYIPTHDKPWCAPSAKYKKETHRTYAGVRCYF